MMTHTEVCAAAHALMKTHGGFARAFVINRIAELNSDEVVQERWRSIRDCIDKITGSVKDARQ